MNNAPPRSYSFLHLCFALKIPYNSYIAHTWQDLRNEYWAMAVNAEPIATVTPHQCDGKAPLTWVTLRCTLVARYRQGNLVIRLLTFYLIQKLIPSVETL